MVPTKTWPAVLIAVLLTSGCLAADAGEGQVVCDGSMPDERREAMAEAVFIAEVLDGDTVDGIVVSPARMRVQEWRKGAGPDEVRVQTAVASSGPVAADLSVGIRPRVGERWLIYAEGVRGEVYLTSECAGSTAVP